MKPAPPVISTFMAAREATSALRLDPFATSRASARGMGRDVAALTAVAGHGPLHAELEAPGLFYTYNVDDGSRTGRVAFVPSTALP